MPDRSSRRVGRSDAHLDEDDDDNREGVQVFLPAQGIDIEVVAFYVKSIDNQARLEVDYQDNRKGYRISSWRIGINPEDVQAMINDSKLFRRERDRGYEGLYVESETAKKRQREGRPTTSNFGSRSSVSAGRTNRPETDPNVRPVPVASGYASQRHPEGRTPNTTALRTVDYQYMAPARTSQTQIPYQYDREIPQATYATNAPPRYGQPTVAAASAPNDPRRPVFSSYESADTGDDRNPRPTHPDTGGTQGFRSGGYPNQRTYQ